MVCLTPHCARFWLLRKNGLLEFRSKVYLAYPRGGAFSWNLPNRVRFTKGYQKRLPKSGFKGEANSWKQTKSVSQLNLQKEHRISCSSCKVLLNLHTNLSNPSMQHHKIRNIECFWWKKNVFHRDTSADAQFRTYYHTQ